MIYQEADVQRVVKDLVEPWKESLPNVPWDLVGQLMSFTLLEHPEIILLTNDQAQQLLQKHEVTLPAGIQISDIAGRANPGIVQARSKLNQAE